jgi:flagellar basal-body rod protein FlgF
MRGLYMAQGSMLTQQVRLELTGNNLANLRTPGFKRDQAVFTTFADHLVYYTGSVTSPAAGRRLIGSMPFNLAVSETVTDFREGPLQETGRALDLALVGPGFFQVQLGPKHSGTV